MRTKSILPSLAVSYLLGLLYLYHQSVLPSVLNRAIVLGVAIFFLILSFFVAKCDLKMDSEYVFSFSKRHLFAQSIHLQTFLSKLQKHKLQLVPTQACICLASLLIAWVWGACYSQHQLTKRLHLVGQFNKSMTIVGRVISLPSRGAYQQRFSLLVDHLGLEHVIIQLSWYLSRHNPLPRLHLGDIWQLNVRLHLPRALLNPGGKDMEAHWLAKGVSAVGSVVNRADNHMIGHRRSLIDQWRNHLFYYIKDKLPYSPVKPLILALSLGFSQGLSSDHYKILRDTGTVHLMAISGLHIGLVAAFFYGIANVLWRIGSPLMLLLPAQQFAALIALLGSTLYAALAGFSLPTQRALCMLTVLLSARLLRRCLVKRYHLWLALLLILIYDPLAALTPAFWLSFVAAWVLLGGSISHRGFGGWCRSFLCIQWRIGLAMIPLTLWFFHQFAYLGFLANLLAVPWISYLVMPFLLLACLCCLLHGYILSAPLFSLVTFSLQKLWYVLHSLSALPLDTWQHHLPLHSLLLMAGTWCLSTMMGGYLSVYSLLGMWLVFLYLPFGKSPAYGQCQLSVLDVGQGLSTVIRTHRHTLVFDMGPRHYGGFDSGTRIVLPYLRHLGITDVNRLIISHSDNDHAGGAPALKQAFPRAIVIDNLKKPNLTSKKIGKKRDRERHYFCKAGLQWEWDGVLFEFLTIPTKFAKPGNDHACVMRVSVGRQAILLPADIEHHAEAYLVEHQRDKLSATVLIAPHHGSISSSSPAFVKAVQPEYVIFPIGWHNRYHFPHQRVVSRYHAISAKLLDTASCGTIEMSLGLNIDLNSSIHCYRKIHHRFWYTH